MLGLGSKAMSATTSVIDSELADQVAQCYADPLAFVHLAFPWGVGELKGITGPDEVQTKFLRDLGREVAKRRFNGRDPVMPIRMAASSGHGTGKSSLGAMIACWILSTRPFSKGTVTANTFHQLETKTWAAILKWAKMCITAHWFHIRATGIYHREKPEDWNVTAATCKEENSQAFAGQHAAQSSSWYMFDEASHVPDGIWTVAEGGLSDGEPMWFVWGQPAKKAGKFYEVCFGKSRDRWNVRTIDSRESRFTNKQQIEEWIQDYGEDSDFVRVRVKGIAPRAGDLQFIDQDRVDKAKKRIVEPFADDPLVCGFDVSGGGQAWNVVWFRRGIDARSIPPVCVPGEHTQERGAMMAKLSEILSDNRPGRKVSMMFVDSAFGAPYVERLKGMGYTNVQEVNFGAPAPDRHQANLRAFMWFRMKEWLDRGGIPDNDIVLETDLTAPGSHLNRSEQLVLESKDDMAKRGVKSPDRGDALALTFAAHVAPLVAEDPLAARYSGGAGSWMG